MPTGPGSSPLLNEMIEALILDALERGATPSEAARSGGVAPRTLRRWCQRGRDADARAREGLSLADTDERMRAFNARVEQAQMLARLRAVDCVQKALTHEEVCTTPWAVLVKDGKPYHPILDEVGATVDGHEVKAKCVHKVVLADWKAGAWYLERIDPEAWGRQTRSPDGSTDTPGEQDDDVMSSLDRKAEALLREIAERIPAEG